MHSVTYNDLEHEFDDHKESTLEALASFLTTEGPKRDESLRSAVLSAQREINGLAFRRSCMAREGDLYLDSRIDAILQGHFPRGSAWHVFLATWITERVDRLLAEMRAAQERLRRPPD